MYKKPFFKLISILIINSFLLLDITCAGAGQILASNKQTDTLFAPIQIGQQQFCVSFDKLYSNRIEKVFVPQNVKQGNYDDNFDNGRVFNLIKIKSGIVKRMGISMLIPLLLTPVLVLLGYNLGWAGEGMPEAINWIKQFISEYGLIAAILGVGLGFGIHKYKTNENFRFVIDLLFCGIGTLALLATVIYSFFEQLSEKYIDLRDFVQENMIFSGIIGISIITGLINVLYFTSYRLFFSKKWFLKYGSSEKLGKRKNKFTKKDVPFLIQATGLSNPKRRERVIYELGELGDTHAVEPLIKALAG